MGKSNRNYKASMFSHLFGEPEAELELLNAFSEEAYPADTVVEDVTLTDVLYMDMVNDLSFLVNGRLFKFHEHQSSINPNIPFRCLGYAPRVYDKVVEMDALYSERLIKLPTPEFFLLYNGVKPFPEKHVYRLSDAFIVPITGEPSLELVVTAYNINQGCNRELISKSDLLSGYCAFIAKVREFEQGGADRSKAIEAAINYCINHGILADYLKLHGSEVLSM